MITPIEVTIEEFEQGAWVADLVSEVAFDGSFDLRGITWVGTAVHSKESFGHFYTTIVGGKGALGKQIRDKYYDGSVSLQAAVQDVCRESGETFGSATQGQRLNSFERLRGSASQALDSIAKAFLSIWWIGRDGAVVLDSSRPSAAEPVGLETSGTVDSVVLSQPESAVLGSTYDGKTVRHIRWELRENAFNARLYFMPFIFRNPSRTDYSSLCDARVDKQNADGTVDVIVSGRFGVTKVPLLSGVPGSKIEVRGGEVVTLGFFGGDPQKPFCVAHGQDSAATKQAARNGDTIASGSVDDSVFWAWLSAAATALATLGVVAPTPTSLSGKITSGSSRIKIGD